MNLLVENPMVLGQMERASSPVEYASIENYDYEYDVFGAYIAFNDEYWEFPNGDIVHCDNLEDYLIEKLGATPSTKK